MKASRWLGGAVILAALGGAAWWGFVRVAEPEASYRTARIERGDLQAAVSATGTVTPVTQVQISSQVSGQIKELLVDFNSAVRQGQLIAQLDPETFEYRVRQSAADVEAARASVLTTQANVHSALAQVNRAQGDVAEAQRDEQRKRDLLARDFISPAELDTAAARTASLGAALKVAQAQLDVARAQVQNAMAIVKQREAQLQQARVDLQRTQIRSPVDGIVIKRSVEVGQTVAASLQAPELFVIARNLSDMQVEAAIDEADISRVRDGQRVSFTIDAFPGRNFDGTVRQVRKAAVSAQNVVSYTVVVGFSNPGSQMLPGMTANVRIVTDTRQGVLKVPNAALRVRIAGLEPAAPAASAGAVGASAAAGELGRPVAMAQDLPARQAAAQRMPGGGPLGEWRQRLVEDLALSAEQTAQVDNVIAAQRPRFAELRNLDEAQRAKAREHILADIRAAIGALLTPQQRERYQKLQVESAARQTTRGRIFVLAPDGKPRAHDVRLGISDGVMTELVVLPTAPDAAVLVEGAKVVTAVLGAGSDAAARARAAGPRPF
jgi:HlyD family secretion protein